MKKCFTLSELFIAAAILITALCGIMLCFTACIFLNQASRNLSRASSHAQYVMEDIKNTDFSSIMTKCTSGDWQWNIATIESNGLSALDSEAITTTVTGTDLLDVNVIVTWQDRGSRWRATSLETLIAEP